MILKVILCAIFVVAKTDEAPPNVLQKVKNETNEIISRSLNVLAEMSDHYKPQSNWYAVTVPETLSNSSHPKLVQKLNKDCHDSLDRIGQLENLARASGVDISECNKWKTNITDLMLKVESNGDNCTAEITKIRTSGLELLTAIEAFSHDIERIRDSEVSNCLKINDTIAMILERIKCFHKLQDDVIVLKSKARMTAMRAITELNQKETLANEFFAVFCHYSQIVNTNLAAFENEYTACANEKITKASSTTTSPPFQVTSTENIVH